MIIFKNSKMNKMNLNLLFVAIIRIQSMLNKVMTMNLKKMNKKTMRMMEMKRKRRRKRMMT